MLEKESKGGNGVLITSERLKTAFIFTVYNSYALLYFLYSGSEFLSLCLRDEEKSLTR